MNTDRIIPIFFTTLYYNDGDFDCINSETKYPRTEHSLYKRLEENNFRLIKCIPSPKCKVFKNKFINPLLDENGYIKEECYGVIQTTNLDGKDIRYVLIKDPNIEQ